MSNIKMLNSNKKDDGVGKGRLPGVYVRASLLLIALIFIITGVLTGQPDVVWTKAINICLECVGIG